MGLHAVLLVLQEIVEFENQFREFVMVLFFCDLVAQDSQALSFLRGHLGLTATFGGILIVEGAYQVKPQNSSLVALIFSCFGDRRTRRQEGRDIEGEAKRELVQGVSRSS